MARMNAGSLPKHRTLSASGIGLDQKLTLQMDPSDGVGQLSSSQGMLQHP